MRAPLALMTEGQANALAERIRPCEDRTPLQVFSDAAYDLLEDIGNDAGQVRPEIWLDDFNELAEALVASTAAELAAARDTMAKVERERDALRAELARRPVPVSMEGIVWTPLEAATISASPRSVRSDAQMLTAIALDIGKDLTAENERLRAALTMVAAYPCTAVFACDSPYAFAGSTKCGPCIARAALEAGR